MIVSSGPTCSGKTTVAKALETELQRLNIPVLVVHQDDFYHTDMNKIPKVILNGNLIENWDDPSGIDFDALFQHVISCPTMTMCILEGNFIWSQLRKHCQIFDIIFRFSISNQALLMRRSQRVYIGDWRDPPGYAQEIILPTLEQEEHHLLPFKEKIITIEMENRRISSDLIDEMLSIICSE